MLMPLIQEHRGPLSVAEACQALGLDPATYHRWKRPPRARKARTSPRALTAQERQQVQVAQRAGQGQGADVDPALQLLRRLLLAKLLVLLVQLLMLLHLL